MLVPVPDTGSQGITFPLRPAPRLPWREWFEPTMLLLDQSGFRDLNLATGLGHSSAMPPAVLGRFRALGLVRVRQLFEFFTTIQELEGDGRWDQVAGAIPRQNCTPYWITYGVSFIYGRVPSWGAMRAPRIPDEHCFR